MSTQTRRRPGEIRDAIFSILFARPSGASVQTIERQVIELIGSAAGSSVRSYLRLNTPTVFVRTARAHYALRLTHGHEISREAPALYQTNRSYTFGRSTVVHADCLDWLKQQQPNSVHAVVTDPPYGLFEYSIDQQNKLRARKGGCGVSLRPLTELSVPLSPGLRFSRLTTCVISSHFSLTGPRY